MKHTPLILGILLLAGCAHFHPRPLSPDQTAAQLQARRLDDAGLKKFLEKNLGQPMADWPATNWNFKELTLVAFYFHPDLEVARDQWLVTRAGVKTAGARPNPTVSVDPSYDTQIPGNYSPWLVPVTFDVPIETAGKRGKRIAEAEKMAESARYSFIQAAWQVRSGVRSSLLDFMVTGRRTRLLQQQLAAQKEIVKLLQQRVDAGEISRPELTTAQIALNQSQLDLNAALSARADARSHLAQALGLPEAALDGIKLVPDNSIPDLAKLTSTDARNVALRSRADILAALDDYAAAEDDLRLQIAKQYPDLHIGPGYAWNNGNAGDNQWILGATLELPILDQNQGPIAGAEASRKLSAAKFVALQAQVIGEIDRAVAGFHVAHDQLRTGNELFDSEQQQEKSAEVQVKAGAADQVDLLSARIALGSAQLAQLDNETRVKTALAALEDALQQPADSRVIEKLTKENPNSKESQP
jgi:cobalt-zinc-cadmium efflux system outer membrane protein